MTADDRMIDGLMKKAGEVLRQRTPLFPKAELDAFVQQFIDRRQEFLGIAQQWGSPLYIIEEQVLLNRARQFTDAFRAELRDVRVFYAVKTNNHPLVARTVVKAGLGLDVSSGLELQMALEAGAKEIVFSGPAKTEPELELAVANSGIVTVLIDSPRELEALDRLATLSGVEIRAGVRLTTDERGLWRKFGIPLADLAHFLQSAEACRSVRIRGLQFHTSWNLDPSNQVNFIRRLGKTLAELPEQARSRIEFLDIGGGFWPTQGEWMLPSATPEGRLRELLDPAAASISEQATVHHRLPAQPISVFAKEIADAIRKEIFPHARPRICAEPGRWIVNDALHLLLTVIDRKGDDIAIIDGATNAIGWERFESDYFPVINLSRPDPAERPFYVLGSLCTPHDVWGYAFFGSDIQPGDVLLIPTQGAYTYSLRQHFIKPLPQSVLLGSDGMARLHEQS